jgi:PilZ domain
MTERRAARRYDLSLPVIVRAPSGIKDAQTQGTTRDVATRGVYLILDRAISRETDVDLTMVLPSDNSGGASVFVRSVGKVVRVEEWSQDGGRRVGVAARILRYEIVRNQSIASPGALSRGL